MMMCMNEADYESQRDEIRCAGTRSPIRAASTAASTAQRPSTTAAGGRWTSPK